MESFDDYQKQARRTHFTDLDDFDALRYAVFGLASEAGEVAGILQKVYQGHAVDKTHVARELGDCLWMISYACDCIGVPMSIVAQMNIDKVRVRYPDGFDPERSLHRKDDDV